jgi:hypothetical protein
MNYLLLITVFCMQVQGHNYELPKTWEKDFSIELYTGGGMRNQSSKVTFSFGRCTYVEMKDDVNTTKGFDLTSADREAILKKLQALNLGKIKTKNNKQIVLDQETSSLCFLTAGRADFCLDDGASTGVDDPAGAFGAAYHYLWDMAIKRSK